jgi:transaldolase
MKLYLDSADTATWVQRPGLPAFAGVTTNPSLVYQAGLAVNVQSYLQLIRRAGELGVRELMVQMPRADGGEIHQTLNTLLPAAALATVQLTVKLPCHPDWHDAVRAVQEHGTPVLLTGLSNAMQLMWAVEQRANWVAPYVGRLEDAGRDVWSLIHACVNAQRYGTQLLAASVRSADVLARLMAAGAAAVTVRPEYAAQWTVDPLTTSAMAQFDNDTAASDPTIA